MILGRARSIDSARPNVSCQALRSRWWRSEHRRLSVRGRGQRRFAERLSDEGIVQIFDVADGRSTMTAVRIAGLVSDALEKAYTVNV